MSSSPPPPASREPETTPEEYRQRALLFSDLGRYDEAAGDIAAGLAVAPDDPALLATLARIHLVAEQPTEALVAAERAVTAAPDTIHPLVVRAMALADNRRFGDAAAVATEILRRWPADAYAQRTGAGLLSEARNGQEALNAAWNGVRIGPGEAEAHLVLAVVAARLGLFDLAQRGYAEALDLDPAIGDAQREFGVVRLERRRWARALEELAEDASMENPPPVIPPGPADYPSPFPRPYQPPGAPAPSAAGTSPAGPPGGPPARARKVDPPARPRRVQPPAVSRPTGPVLEVSADSTAGLRQSVLYGATGVIVATVLTATMTAASPGASRVWAGMIGTILFVAVLGWLSRRLTEPAAKALARARAANRPLAVAAYATFTAPLLLVLYAVLGSLIPLVAALAVAAAAQLLLLTSGR